MHPASLAVKKSKNIHWSHNYPMPVSYDCSDEINLGMSKCNLRFSYILGQVALGELPLGELQWASYQP